jgi:hypothetical protein
MLTGPSTFYTVIAAVRDAVATALTSTTGGAPSRVAVVPGAIAWDECDTCGMLALSLLRTFLSDDFPIELAQPASLAGTQGALLCADMAVQVIRCAPQPADRESAPTTEQLDAAGRITSEDAYATLCAVLSILGTMETNDSILSFVVRPVNVVGPEGACVGIELMFTVGVIR